MITITPPERKILPSETNEAATPRTFDSSNMPNSLFDDKVDVTNSKNKEVDATLANVTGERLFDETQASILQILKLGTSLEFGTSENKESQLFKF